MCTEGQQLGIIIILLLVYGYLVTYYIKESIYTGALVLIVDGNYRIILTFN